MDKIKSGVISDPRPIEEQAKDYTHEEVASAVPLNWNRDISGAPAYSIRDQDGSSSCVEQASQKAVETITGVVTSAHPNYRRRSNYPAEGMYLQDAGQLQVNQGTTTEALDPSQNNYVMVNIKNIDDIATAIETYKHCIITIQSSMPEWNVVQPVVMPNEPITFGHGICGVYYFTTPTNQKAILIDENWGTENIERRILTEDFLKARGTGAMYFISGVLPPTPKPQFIFQTTLLYGNSNYSVKELQDCLKYFGFFPLNIPSTGNYLSITAQAVLKWQLANNVDTVQALNNLQGKSFGPKSIAVMNALLK